MVTPERGQRERQRGKRERGQRERGKGGAGRGRAGIAGKKEERGCIEGRGRRSEAVFKGAGVDMSRVSVLAVEVQGEGIGLGAEGLGSRIWRSRSRMWGVGCAAVEV